ncbi:hypothetical protein LCGC14_2766210, partial [marine sediment metagenome]
MGKGEYAFNPSLLGQAHQQCQNRAIEALKKGNSPVVIDNTNTRLWEMKKLKPIIQLAQSLGYSVKIEEPETEWWKSKNIEEMVNKNTHKCPREVIEKMVNRFDENITVDNMLENRDTLKEIEKLFNSTNFISNFQYSNKSLRSPSEIAERSKTQLDKTLYYSQEDISME